MDRNTKKDRQIIKFRVSLSARRAWIEICTWPIWRQRTGVALRKESVDRNLPDGIQLRSHRLVALRKESVDRNIQTKDTPKTRKKSLSARRAWIEITEKMYHKA